LKRWSRVAAVTFVARPGALLTRRSFVSDGTAALSTTILIWTGWLAGGQPASATRCLLTYSRFLPPPPLPLHAGPFAEVSGQVSAKTIVSSKSVSRRPHCWPRAKIKFGAFRTEQMDARTLSANDSRVLRIPLTRVARSTV
jgi:hypothetical protein